MGTTHTRKAGKEGIPRIADGIERGTKTIEDSEKRETIRERKETSRERIQERAEICQGTEHRQTEIDAQCHVEEAIEEDQEDKNEHKDRGFGVRLSLCKVDY